MGPRIVQHRVFKWDKVKVVAPGGDLERLCRSGPAEIWDLFQGVNPQTSQKFLGKIRSCLTHVFLLYLGEAKSLRLLSESGADELKRKWKDSLDWHRLEEFSKHQSQQHHLPSETLPFQNLSLLQTSQSSTTTKGIDQTNLNTNPNEIPVINNRLLLSTTSTARMDPKDHKKQKTSSKKALAGNKPLSTLSPEESADLWLDYNLRSVLESHPPSNPRDPGAIHAVERARPYLLSLKTKLTCLLLTAENELVRKEIESAFHDVDTAWECLRAVRSDEDTMA